MDSLIYVTRLTWNINGWKRPSGARGKTESSNVAKYGFGMEEWLNRSECEVDGWRYAVLQGLHKRREKFAGQTLRILLYSIEPRSHNRLYVGELESAQIIDGATERRAIKAFRKRGLLATMRREVAEAGGKAQVFKGGANIRFRPDALNIFQVPIPARHSDPVLEFKRYFFTPVSKSVIRWWKSASAKRRPPLNLSSIDPVIYKRASRLVTMELTEKKMQREIKSILEKRFGAGTVEAEIDRRDLTLRTELRRALMEIKANQNTKMAVRDALGQILEYAYFDPANRENDDELFIISRGTPTCETEQYLDHLLEKFGLRVTYLQYHLGSHRLDFPGA